MFTILSLVDRLVSGLDTISNNFSFKRDVLGLTYPVPFEAVLRTEVTVFDALLQTRWALQAPSFIVAVGSRAFLLGIGHCHSELKFQL